MVNKNQALDATIDLFASRGYAATTLDLVATSLHVPVQEVRKSVGERRAWISDSFARLLERRLAQFEEIARSLGSAEPRPETTWHALMQTILTAGKVDPLFAVTYEMFFGSRGDRVLLDRLLQVRRIWEPRIESAAAGFFAPTISIALRRLILIQMEALGAAFISNGSGSVEFGDSVGKIVRKLLDRNLLPH